MRNQLGVPWPVQFYTAPKGLVKQKNPKQSKTKQTKKKPNNKNQHYQIFKGETVLELELFSETGGR